MSENIASPPERLLKKKCLCGSSLKLFSIVGLPFMPEWITVEMFKFSITNEIPKFYPGIQAQALICGIAFTATCDECGAITAWDLSLDELDYLLSNNKEPGYGVAWVYNPEKLKEIYDTDTLRGYGQRIIEIAKIVDDQRLKSERSRNEKK